MMISGTTDRDLRQNAMIANAVIGQPGWRMEIIPPGQTPTCNPRDKVLRVQAFAPGLSPKQELRIRATMGHECGHGQLSMEGSIKNALVHEITNALEDLRIESALSQQYAGLGPAIQTDNEALCEEIGQAIVSGKCKMKPLREALTRLMFEDQHLTLAGVPSAKAQHYMDLIRDKFVSWHFLPKVTEKAGFPYLEALAVEIAEMLREDKAKEKEEERKEEQKKSGKGDSGDKSEDGDGNAKDGKPESGDKDGKGKSGKKPEDKDESGGKDGDKGDEKPDTGNDGETGNAGNEIDDDEDEAPSSGSGSKPEGDDDGDEDGGTPGTPGDGDGDGDAPKAPTKEELDAELEGELDGKDVSTIRQESAAQAALDSAKDDPDRYVSDASADEWIVPKANNAAYTASKATSQAVVGKLQRTLEQALIADMKCRVRRNLEEGSLDMQALHHICKGTSRAVFTRTAKGQKTNTAVVIVMDESGSMSSNGKVTAMKALAIALGESLDRIGIPFEVIGASTKGGRSLVPGVDRMNPILYMVYKSFGERWGATRSRLGTVEARANNVDGEVIMSAGKRLLARRESRRVLISLSDGQPAAGHNNNVKMGKNLKRVCGVLRAAGLEVYGFGMLTTAPSQYYGSEWFVYAPNIAEMGVKFFSECARIIKGKGKARG